MLYQENEFLKNFFLRQGPRKMVLIIDVDNTPIDSHSLQEVHSFNGHNDCNCHLPQQVFIESDQIAVVNGTAEGCKHMLEVIRPLFEAIRGKRPDTPILLRADSGFSNTALIDLSLELGIYYLIRLTKNCHILDSP